MSVMKKTGLVGLGCLCLQSVVLTLGQAIPSDVRVLEPAEIQWQAVPGYPPGYERAMLEGKGNEAVPITYRVRLPDGFQFPPHTHPWTEHVTVLHGTWRLGIGKTFDIAKTRRLRTGSFAIIPAGVPHFVVAEGQTICQVHGLGPVGMKFVEPNQPAGKSPVKPKNHQG